MPVVVKLMGESCFSDIDRRMQVIFVSAKIVGVGRMLRRNWNVSLYNRGPLRG